jgi:thiamine-monophosphate kinase
MKPKPGTLAAIGEQALIARLTRRLSLPDAVVVGPGDDCAVVRPAAGTCEDLLLTSDPVIENVHVAHGTAGADVGHKAVGRVLSDIAAMGGTPLWLLIDLVAPPACPVAWVEEVYRGATALARRCGAAIVGGDTAAGACAQLHVFGVGSVARGRALLRSGARPGDALFVTGSLGGSAAGKHLHFEPRLREGRFLLDWATAAMDISDGLGTDLRTLMRASGTGCRLRAASLPLSDAVLSAATTPVDAVRRALCDGEDFELLFTVPSDRCEPFLAAWRNENLAPVSRIGRVTAATAGIKIEDESGRVRPFDARGYEHFHAQAN